MAAKAKNPGVAAGKRRVTTVEETVEEGAAGAELNLEPADAEGEGGDDFLDVLADLAGGSEAKCEVRRTSPAEFAGYCATYALSEMQAGGMDRIQSEWGGGKFNVRVRNARGEFKGSTSIQIAGKARNRDDGPAAVAAPAQSAPDLGGILRAAMEANKPQIDMLTSLVTALINKPAPPAPPAGPSVLEIIGELTPLLRPEKSGGDTGDAVKLLLQGIELGKDLSGGGGEESFLSLAAKGLDTVKDLAKTGQQRMIRRPAKKPVPALAPPGTVAAQEPAAEPLPIVDPQDSPMLKLLNWIKQQAALLCYQAARGKEPGLYADLFLDNIPEGVSLDDIYERMAKPDAIASLAEITGNANVLEFPEWMERFRQAVLAGIGEPDEVPRMAEEPGEPAVGADGGEGG